jgi:hypothetical protein
VRGVLDRHADIAHIALAIHGAHAPHPNHALDNKAADRDSQTRRSAATSMAGVSRNAAADSG